MLVYSLLSTQMDVSCGAGNTVTNFTFFISGVPLRLNRWLHKISFFFVDHRDRQCAGVSFQFRIQELTE